MHLYCMLQRQTVYIFPFLQKIMIILQYNLEIDMHALDALCVNTPGVWSSI